MFEKIVRPFQAPQVLATQRIVKSVSPATGEVAILTWGAAGTIPAGASQRPVTTQDPGGGGFTLQNAQDDWTQAGPPVTENVDVGGATVKRVREITFQKINPTSNLGSFDDVGQAVTDVVAGLLRSIEGSRATRSKYKTSWD